MRQRSNDHRTGADRVHESNNINSDNNDGRVVDIDHDRDMMNSVDGCDICVPNDVKKARYRYCAPIVSRNEIQVTNADLESGCKSQMRASLRMCKMSRRIIPRFGFDALVVERPLRAALKAAAYFEKARTVLSGEWGFNTA